MLAYFDHYTIFFRKGNLYLDSFEYIIMI
jgi:hypothetical protein